MDSLSHHVLQAVQEFKQNHQTVCEEYKSCSNLVVSNHKAYFEKKLSIDVLRQGASENQVALLVQLASQVEEQFADLLKQRERKRALEMQLKDHKWAMKESLDTLLELYKSVHDTLSPLSGPGKQNDETIVNVGHVLFETVNYQIRSDPPLFGENGKEGEESKENQVNASNSATFEASLDS